MSRRAELLEKYEASGGVLVASGSVVRTSHPCMWCKADTSATVLGPEPDTRRRDDKVYMFYMTRCNSCSRVSKRKLKQ